MKDKVIIAKHNIDQEPNTPTKYGIRGIPTMLLFKEGELKATKVGEGYGLEIALGRIEQEVLDYFIENNVSLTDFVNGDIEIPEKYRPFESEAWFECDDIAHVHGLQLENDGKICISEGSKILAEFNATYD